MLVSRLWAVVCAGIFWSIDELLHYCCAFGRASGCRMVQCGADTRKRLSSCSSCWSAFFSHLFWVLARLISISWLDHCRVRGKFMQDYARRLTLNGWEIVLHRIIPTAHEYSDGCNCTLTIEMHQRSDIDWDALLLHMDWLRCRMQSSPTPGALRYAFDHHWPSIAQLSNIAPMRPLDENPIMITFHRYRSASLPPSASAEPQPIMKMLF